VIHALKRKRVSRKRRESGERSQRTTRRAAKRDAWLTLPDEELLDVRLRALDVSIEGTWLEEMIARLYDEMEARGLVFRPHCWLSNEWFSPDGVPGVALPFYLAHPRLMRLERNQMFEVEGGTRESCMRILRHEAGHAIDTAYRLRRKRRWQQAFGRSSLPYPSFYRPNPYSRKYVLHLPWWYAQSHPLEDFAETFAVWLRPRSAWRAKYRDWPVALGKLEAVDALMAEIGDRTPPVRSRLRVDAVSGNDKTLRQHYRRRQAYYEIDVTGLQDGALRQLFAEPEGSSDRRPAAAAFLRGHRKELREVVASRALLPAYTVDQFLNEMIGRCRVQRLRQRSSARRTLLEAAVVLTVEVVSWVQSGGRRVAL
jgi:hypothetical protein